MASSGNFSTMNPLNRTSGSVVYTNGNLSFSPGSSWSSTTFTRNNMYIPKDKKIYFELYHKTQNGYYAGYGFGAENAPVTSSEFGATGCITTYYGNTRVNGTQTSSQFTSPSEGDIIQFAIDGSNNKVWFGINNTWVLSGDPANGSNEIGTITTNSTVGYDIGFIAQQNAVSTLTMNFGQDSTFAGDVTAGGNADANGFGDFKYAPPTGFLALCSGNLSVSDDIDPAQTDDDYPAKNFNLLTYTGNGGANSVTGLGFKPDFVIGLNRSAGQSKRVLDSSRGGNNYVFTDQNSAQVAGAGSGDTIEFLSDGIKWNNTNGNNDNSVTYAAACWKANGGTTASNSNGSITSTVQTNPSQSFSIVTYTGTGSNATIGHGLSASPDCVWIKNLSQNDSWLVYNSCGLLGNSKFISLDLALSSALTGSSYMQDTSPSSTVISLGTSHLVNASSENYVAYCWRNVEGFQKFSDYLGNGNNDGAFVYTGFRPRMVILAPLRFSGSPHWAEHDTARETFNPCSTVIDLDDTYAEYSSSGRAIDILSNGFKARTSDNAINTTSGLAYFAWGDVPFKYNNTF